MGLFSDIVSTRHTLYVILALFSFILLGLTAGRLSYTMHLPKGDPLNHGKDFVDPVVAELLVVAIFLVIVSVFFARVIHTRKESRYLTRLMVEVPVLCVLWLMLIVGTGIATNIWPNLTFCMIYTACQVLQAMLAFAWLCWLLLTALIVTSMLYATRNHRWDHHVHSWDHNWLQRNNEGGIMPQDEMRQSVRESEMGMDGQRIVSEGHAYESHEP